VWLKCGLVSPAPRGGTGNGSGNVIVIAKNRTCYAQWFASFAPPKIEEFEEGRRIAVDRLSQRGYLGLVPEVVDGVEYSLNNEKWRLQHQHLTPFGQSLLDLLRSEGIRSSNETIRTTSQQVVDALTQIAELEKE